MLSDTSPSLLRLHAGVTDEAVGSVIISACLPNRIEVSPDAAVTLRNFIAEGGFILPGGGRVTAGRSTTARDWREMKAERSAIESQLAKHGWSIVEVEDRALDWWADEIWRLESAWSPVGARAYVTFLVDPQSSTPGRKKGQGIWAVKASAVNPVDWGTGEGELTLDFRRGWEDGLPGFFEHLATLRNRGL